MADFNAIFRFMDLPAELRNKIYKELLCRFTFHDEPTGLPDNTLIRIMDQDQGQQFHINEATSTAKTSILLVSRDIHREAYDVMIKTNQFIRVKGHDFNWSELLPRARIPVVTMDRQRVSQFRGYMLCMAVEEDILDSEDENRPLVLFDFMILGLHWKHLCQAVSYLHSALDGTSFHLEFDPSCMIDQSGYRSSIDISFMEKTQQFLLEPLRAYLRGIEAFTVKGLVHADFGKSVKSQVSTKPWLDRSAWLSQLEEKCQLVERVRGQGKLFEAFALWENLSSESQWIPIREVTASPDLSKIYASIFAISSIGRVRCFLDLLRSPPPHASDRWFKDMVSHAYFTVRAFLGDCRPKIRAQFLLFEAQLKILVEMRTGNHMDLLSAQRIAATLLQAEELDPDNEEITEEEQKLLEVSDLQQLTIRDIATAL
ncbi:hypothetical protein DE146DRAFT_760725 [Phaeosphaeria sp. MPI-PUGE-AT-0046c]|nr:hypothetical protein DE146DRAFT_760725 [Phaeosphaeria sp. MPI-PUGE-AT-0046c]